MKQPTLEEVKEYFKNAKEVKCLFDGKIYDITKGIITQDNKGRFESLFEDGQYCRLQKFDSEYAEILTYKEKTFSITESQIKELVELTGFQSKTNYKLKEWFPENI